MIKINKTAQKYVKYNNFIPSLGIKNRARKKVLKIRVFLQEV
jgi:hypothetical protein